MNGFSKMKTYLFGALALVAVFSGACSGSVSTAMDSTPIRLPENYSSDNYRKICIAVRINGAPEGVARYFGTELTKTNRFASPQASENPLPVELVFSGNMTVSKEKRDLPDSSVLIYTVMCHLQGMNLKNGMIVFSDTVQGRHLIKATGSSTEIPVNASDEAAAIETAAEKVVDALVQKINQAYPLGGRVIECDPETGHLVLDKGTADGVANGQEYVIYMSDNGLDVPLAVATAIPSETETRLQIVNCNTVRDVPQPKIKALQEAPQDFVMAHRVYAVCSRFSPAETTSAAD